MLELGVSFHPLHFLLVEPEGQRDYDLVATLCPRTALVINNRRVLCTQLLPALMQLVINFGRQDYM